MKNFSLILNLVLLVALGLLYYLHFSAASTTQNHQPNYYGNDSLSGASIAFVNLDTLLLQYSYSKDLNQQLTDKKTKYQQDFQRKISDLEKQAADFQDKLQRGGFLTEQRAKDEQERILGEQERLQKLEYDLSNRLVEEQQTLNLRLYDSISNFLEEYNKTRYFTCIISHTYGGPLLYADKRTDITREVVDMLNNRMKKGK